MDRLLPPDTRMLPLLKESSAGYPRLSSWASFCLPSFVALARAGATSSRRTKQKLRMRSSFPPSSPQSPRLPRSTNFAVDPGRSALTKRQLQVSSRQSQQQARVPYRDRNKDHPEASQERIQSQPSIQLLHLRSQPPLTPALAHSRRLHLSRSPNGCSTVASKAPRSPLS